MKGKLLVLGVLALLALSLMAVKGERNEELAKAEPTAIVEQNIEVVAVPVYHDSGLSLMRIHIERAKAFVRLERFVPLFTSCTFEIVSEGVERLSNELEPAFLSAVQLNFEGLIPKNINPALYRHLGNNPQVFFALNATVDEAVKAAFESVKAESGFENILLDNRAELPWQPLAALYKNYGEGLASLLQASLTAELVLTEDGELCLSVGYPEFDLIADRTDEKLWFSARFDYYYLNTYYDQDGGVRDTSYQPLDANYLETLKLPVEAVYEAGIKPGWYKGRSSGSRRHMGTDIKGASGSALYSCTDGIVTCTGYNSIAGYYVCVLDSFGYEYHYYHMYELSEFVQAGDTVLAGQQIGRMGSTGNSDANHLHLAIVTPEHYHIDPYEVLTQAGFGNGAN